jgi:hypothetical protein
MATVPPPQDPELAQIIAARSWTPDQAGPDDEPPTDRFLRAVCVTFQPGDSAQGEATQLLLDHPELPSRSLAVAAACADVAAVQRFLAADPASARASSGPYNWSPLLYLAYARPDPAPGLDATLRTAQLLLDAGADPNDGRFWHGLPTPFTVLTGVFGQGEQSQPEHPQTLPLARLLLAAGADPNDGQVLYNRMFDTDDDHLVLLFEFGLGQGGDGPWYQLIGAALESPPVLLRNLLWWAITHDQRQRVALLAAHGVDVVSPFHELRMPGGNGRSPVEVALLSGHRALADDLLALGAAGPDLDPVAAFIADALAGDTEAVQRTEPAVIRSARRQRPGLLVWAAAQAGPDVAALLVGAGFEVNAFGRSDAPIEQRWQTALHVAAGDGNLELARRLLDLGADPDLRDIRFDATALDWARRFDQQPLIELLTPLTTLASGNG